MVICLHNEIQLVTKSNTFHCFFVSMTTSVLRSKKQNSFRFWYIYTCFIIHLHLWNSLRKGSVPSVHPGLDLLCRLLPVTLSCFLSVGWWAWPESERKKCAGQVRTVIWLCTHSWSVHGFNTQQHYFLRSKTHTCRWREARRRSTCEGQEIIQSR